MKLAIVLCLLVPLATTLQASDPLAYEVSISKTGNEQLDHALADYSMLVSLEKVAPVGPFALIMRATDDQQRFRTALKSYGYYKGKAVIQISGMAADDPALVEKLEGVSSNESVLVDIAVELGPLYQLGKVEIHGNVPENASKKLGLASGSPAVAADVLEARERLLDALRDEGYALAKVDEPIAIIQDEKNTLDVSFKVEPGQPMYLGPITLSGLEDVNENYIRSHLLVQSGERYNPTNLEKARRDLMTIGVFSSVQVLPADAPNENGRLPIEFRIQESAPRKLSFNGQYSTDVGGSISTAWENRNLFGNAEKLTLSAAVTQLGGRSTQGIGYNTLLSILKPDFLHHEQSLQIDIGAVQQSLLAYDRRAFTIGALLNRNLADHWSASIGLSAEQERIRQQGATNDYTLIELPLEVKYDNTENLLDPTRGIRASAGVTPTQPLTGPSTNPFVLFLVSGSTYLDLGDEGRSVLALRGVFGLAEGASQAELPPDRRFYAGGSATVRGYKYQSIGPQFPDQTPQGGTALSAGTVELRQRFLESYGAVAFVDAGQVTTKSTLFSGTWRVGAGLGVRYYTAFGPIRLDVAVPVNSIPGGSAFELYIGLGQAF